MALCRQAGGGCPLLEEREARGEARGVRRRPRRRRGGGSPRRDREQRGGGRSARRGGGGARRAARVPAGAASVVGSDRTAERISTF